MIYTLIMLSDINKKSNKIFGMNSNIIKYFYKSVVFFSGSYVEIFVFDDNGIHKEMVKSS